MLGKSVKGLHDVVGAVDAAIRWDREKKKQELKERPPEADFSGIHKDPVLRSQVIAELEAILNDPTADYDPTDLQSMMDGWNAAGAKVLPRDKRKPYLGTVISWDLREVKDIEARIKSANKLFGSVKSTFWSNARVPFALRMRFYKAIIVNVLLWGCESWAIQPKEMREISYFIKSVIDLHGSALLLICNI